MNQLIDRLVESFRQFPGIGPRQARRFVYFLLGEGDGYITRLSSELLALKDKINRCVDCGRFFALSGGKVEQCTICSDTNRNRELLMVVEKDIDLEAVRKAGIYDGHFFVLGGNIPILEKNPEEKVRIKELKTRLAKGEIKELILALSATTEGDYTAEYLKKALLPPPTGGASPALKISTLGRGLSTGTELEYSDTDTLKSALKNRG